MPQAERNEAVAGVGHERHPRVAHQRDSRALLQRHDQFRRAGQLIVFMVADERLVNVVVIQELLTYGACPRRQFLSTSFRMRSARSVMSSRLPIGVPTR